MIQNTVKDKKNKKNGVQKVFVVLILMMVFIWVLYLTFGVPVGGTLDQ